MSWLLIINLGLSNIYIIIIYIFLTIFLSLTTFEFYTVQVMMASKVTSWLWDMTFMNRTKTPVKKYPQKILMFEKQSAAITRVECSVNATQSVRWTSLIDRHQTLASTNNIQYCEDVEQIHQKRTSWSHSLCQLHPLLN